MPSTPDATKKSKLTPELAPVIDAQGREAGKGLFCRDPQNQPSHIPSSQRQKPQTPGPNRTWTFCPRHFPASLCAPLLVLLSLRQQPLLRSTKDPCDTPRPHS